MARLFDDASNEYLNLNSAILSAPPLAFAGWFNSNDATDSQRLMGISDTNGNSTVMLQIRGDMASDPILMVTINSAGDVSFATSTAGFSANTWHHACGIWASTTDVRVLFDGGNKDTETTNISPSGLDNTTIGAIVRSDAGPAFGMSGLIAETAIWDLSSWPGATDADKANNFEKIILSLAAGYSPLFYPLGLVSYWPLIRDDDKDIVGGNNMTAVNTPSIGAHPRIIYPSKIWVPYKAAVVSGTILPQITNAYMKVSA